MVTESCTFFAITFISPGLYLEPATPQTISEHFTCFIKLNNQVRGIRNGQNIFKYIVSLFNFFLSNL